MKMEAIYSSEKSLTFTGLHYVISQKKELFMVSISQNLIVLVQCFNEVVDNILDDCASIPCRKKEYSFRHRCAQIVSRAL
jgi:hypothetical protein